MGIILSPLPSFHVDRSPGENPKPDPLNPHQKQKECQLMNDFNLLKL
jgi:hypothetical protein